MEADEPTAIEQTQLGTLSRAAAAEMSNVIRILDADLKQMNLHLVDVRIKDVSHPAFTITFAIDRWYGDGPGEPSIRRS
jgi:Cu/Ag efflux protein CusF